MPFGYAGKNASYYAYWMILISAAKIGGNKILLDIDNLADNAWNNDAVKQAAAAVGRDRQVHWTRRYEGLIHTEVQTQQNQGKVAFYPSGSWLEAEQAKDTPEGFEYAHGPDPLGHRRRPDALRGASAPRPPRASWCRRRPRTRPDGLEYLRQMLSSRAPATSPRRPSR